MTVRLTFVGSGDAFAGGGRFEACLHLHGGPEPLLLDCGATTLVALKRLALDPGWIGNIAPNHPHVVPLTGIGLFPAIKIEPDHLEFGEQELNTASSPRSLTVTNSDGLVGTTVPPLTYP